MNGGGIVAAARDPSLFKDKTKKRKKLKPTYHSAMDHGKRETVTDYSIKVVGKAADRSTSKKKRRRRNRGNGSKKSASGTKRKQAQVHGADFPSSKASKVSTPPLHADSIKKAAKFSPYYGAKKEGKVVVRAVSIKEKWPSAGDETSKKRDKSTVINKLLGKAGIDRKDAIQNYVGIQVVDDLVVRGYLTFFEKVVNADGTETRKRKNVITPKSFWGIRMPYFKIIENFSQKFGALRDARIASDDQDVDDIVTWAEIKKHSIYMKSTRRVKNPKTGKREPAEVNVPLDSRKATQLLIDFDALIRTGKDPNDSGNGSVSAARAVSAKASQTGLSKPRKSGRSAPSKKHGVEIAAKRASAKAKEVANKRLEELKLDPTTIRWAINMVKDKFILPSRGDSEKPGKDKPPPEGDPNDPAYRTKRNEWKIEQTTRIMADAVCNAVDKSCPDGVVRYMSLDNIPSDSNGDDIRNTVLIKGAMTDDVLSRIRSQYTCPMPTDDDFALLAGINLRNKFEISAGEETFRKHNEYVGEIIDVTAFIQLQKEGLGPGRESFKPLKNADRLPATKNKQQKKSRKKKDPPLPAAVQSSEIKETPKGKSACQKTKKKTRKRDSPEPVESSEEEETESEDTGGEHTSDEDTEDEPTSEWLERFTHAKLPLVRVFRKIREWILKTQGVQFYYDNIDKVSPVMQSLIDYRPSGKDAQSFTLDSYPDFGHDMMTRMTNQTVKGSNAKESVALLLYLVYSLFLYTKCEQDLPWYVEPPKKRRNKGEEKGRKTSKWDALGFDFDDDESATLKKESTTKIPSMYDDTIYAERKNWKDLSQNGTGRNLVFRVTDGRQVAVRLCAVGEAMIRDGAIGRPKGARKHLGIDLATTPAMVRKTRIYTDPFTFWMWMAFMTEIFIGPIPKVREESFKDIPKFNGSKLPVFEKDPFE